MLTSWGVSPLSELEAAATRMQHNKLGVALANKLARIAWSVLNSGKHFDWKEKELATAICSQPCTIFVDLNCVERNKAHPKSESPNGHHRSGH